MPNPQTDLAKGLSDDETATLWALGSTTRVSAGTVLFNLGDPADRVFQVVNGRVSLTLPMQVRDRLEDVMVEERLGGETLGWSGLIPPNRYTLKALAPIDTELLVFPRDELLRLFGGNPTIAVIVTQNVAAVIGHRLKVFQTMWTREMQRTVELRYS